VSEVDPLEAPPGYFAVPKASVPQDKGNLCRFCDWRPACQRSGDEDDRLGEKYPCAGYEVINRDGQTIGRRDRTSVVFRCSPFVADEPMRPTPDTPSNS